MKATKISRIVLLAAAGVCLLHSCTADKSIPEAKAPSDTKVAGKGEEATLPEPEKDPDAFYSHISGKWRVEAGDWLHYDDADKQWKTGGTDPGYSGVIMGDAKNEMLFGFGFWDASFGFMANVGQSGSFSIPVDPATNPVARVAAGLSSYILFVTLYDFDTEYFYPIGNSIDATVSDDGRSFRINAVEGEVTDGNGSKVKTNYSYLALIGIKESGSGYTMFSNWSFPLTPSFEAVESAPATRAAAFSGEDYIRLRAEWERKAASATCVSPINRITETVDAAAIDAIEYFWPLQ